MYTPGLPDVTITVLDITLRLCTIPRLRLPEATHYVVKQFLRQRPTFLNITLNTSELSIFAEDTTLDDFRPLAHRGRFRGPGAPVEISPDTWSVLQIDEDKFGDAGTRVCEISAALARAGISILYQSSYMSDFILVKSSSLPSVIALLAHAGFGLYSTDAISLTAPPLIVPHIAPEDSRLSIRGSLVFEGEVNTHGLALGLINMDDTFAVSPKQRQHRSASIGSFQSITLPPGAFAFAASTVSPLSSLSTESSDSEQDNDEAKPRKPRGVTKLPPTVEAVAADLAVIGLNEDASDSWLSRMILLMLYPNMIITPWASPAACKPQDGEDFDYETPAELDNSLSPLNEERDRLSLPTSPLSPTASHSSGASFQAEPASSTVRSRSADSRSGRSSPPSQPFFSFTRAKGECASVVADVRLLASLFPPPDRHMVLSAHELEGVDEIAMTSGDVKAAMRCLTIDLPHGLGQSSFLFSAKRHAHPRSDTHGLVNHFSSILHTNGINHLYSSTYKTANLLVDRQDAERAEALLRSP
ncbi:hypothetical protein CTheo_2286 [Ceratobasidium theobromae]|uniref:CASTOR ACT domain-containing protein n=1 Tax=Ceratobasidium theobromae TaxID=1582974 RepID=A0A5N5QR32_9AGAM|nr:hypothetical protein CTheo_2286 [Ceratobasidium theobromae]